MRRKLVIEPLETRCLLSVAPLLSSDLSTEAGPAGFTGQAESSSRNPRSAIAQIGKLGLRLHEFGLFENWGGLSEKWLLGHAGWYFITPSGSLHKWNASPRDNLTGDLVVHLDSRYHAQPELIFRAQDHFLDGELGLHVHEAGLFEDWGGLGEKWLLGHAAWYFITPDGSLYESDDSPRDRLTGKLVARFDVRYHENPWLLYGAQDYYLDRELGLYPDPTGLWEDWGGLAQWWLC